MTEAIILMTLAFIQNVSFTMVSRARNRDNKTYHALCSVFSNGLWFLSVGVIIQSQLDGMNLLLAIPYIIGTVGGSLFGSEVSIKIEKIIGAKT